MQANRTENRRADLLGLALIALATAAVYGHTLDVPWYLDDYPDIVENPAIRDLGGSLRQLFARRGLALFTFALDYRLGGLEPTGYHLVNVTIHLLTSGLVYLLLKRVSRDSAVLPLLGALLFLLALYLFVRARERLAAGAAFDSPAHLGCYLGALLAGALSLLSKETALILPLAVLLFARFFLPGQDRRWRPLLLYLAPFLAAPLAFAVLHLLAPLAQGESLHELAGARSLVDQRESSPLLYLATECSVLWVYLRLLFLPFGQALDHDYPVVRQMLTLQSTAAGLGLAVLGALAFGLRRRQPRVAFGIAWFFLTLAVESTLVPLDPLFEHRLYLPMFGFCVAAVGLCGLLPEKRLRTAVLLTAVLALALLAWQRNRLWRDPVAFHEDNRRRAPQSERVATNLGRSYLEQGRYIAAEAVLREAIRLNPDYEVARYNLGLVHYRQGRTPEARQEFLAAVQLQPRYAKALFNAAAVSLELGDLPTAKAMTARLEEINPTDAAELRRGIAKAQGR